MINKGKASMAPTVTIIFFQFISENEKTGFSFSSLFLRLAMIRFIKEKIPRIKEARNGRNPGPGNWKLPKETLTEDISMAPATTNGP